MELVFGTQVRSAGRRLGYLAGLEVDPATRAVVKIVFSEDGKLGPRAHARSLGAVRAERRALVVQTAPSSAGSTQQLLWSRATRFLRDGHESGRLAGAVVGDDGKVEQIAVRQSWWKRRQRVTAAGLDISVPGEIRQVTAGTMAA